MIFRNIIKLLYMTLANPLSQLVWGLYLYYYGDINWLLSFPLSALPILFKGFFCGIFTHILFAGMVYLLATPRPLKARAWQYKQKFFDIFYESTASLRRATLIFIGIILFVFISPIIFFFWNKEELMLLISIIISPFLLWIFLEIVLVSKTYKKYCQIFYKKEK